MAADWLSRFTFHRGDTSAGRANSLAAIRRAAEQKVDFVEFDVMYHRGLWRTGHPWPQSFLPLYRTLSTYLAPLDSLNDVLGLFKGREAYPKVDIKLYTIRDHTRGLDEVIRSVEEASLPFTLLNVGIKGRQKSFRAQKYLYSKVDPTKVKLNIDPQYLRPRGGAITPEIHRHLQDLGDFVYAISPEIHSENLDQMGRLAEEHKIPVIGFWLSGRKVSPARLQEALSLEDRYDVRVLFDLDRRYVRG